MITPPIAQKIVRLRLEQRLPYREIAARVRMGVRKVIECAQAAGVPSRTAAEISRTASDRALRALEMRRAELTFAEIGERMGCNRRKAHRLVKRGRRIAERRAAAGKL